MEEMGIITNPRFGLDDRGVVALQFGILTLNGSSLQIFRDWEDIETIIKDASISDVYHLTNKPVRVFRENGIVRFLGIVKL